MSTENYYEQNLKLESILELIQILNLQSSFEEILRVISAKAMHLFEADSAKVMMLNPETEHTIKTIYKQQKGSFIQNYHLLNVNIAGWVQKNQKSFITADLKGDARLKPRFISKY